MPVIGVGGIATLDDVMEFLVAGAGAVQLGTVNFYDPTASMRIVEQLPAALDVLGAKAWVRLLAVCTIFFVVQAARLHGSVQASRLHYENHLKLRFHRRSRHRWQRPRCHRG